MVSTRRSQTDKHRNLEVGDKVEILRGAGVAIGKLVRPIVAATNPVSTAASTHWVVSMDGGTEEDISERMMGRVISPETESDCSTVSVRNASSITSGVKTEETTVKKAPVPRTPKVKGFLKSTSNNSTPKAKPHRPSTKNGRKTKLSQGAVHGAARTTRAAMSRWVNTAATTTTASSSLEMTLSTTSAAIPTTKSKNHQYTTALPQKRLSDGSKLIKVKMLTGTLFLYRGATRSHAKFVFAK